MDKLTLVELHIEKQKEEAEFVEGVELQNTFYESLGDEDTERLLDLVKGIKEGKLTRQIIVFSGKGLGKTTLSRAIEKYIGTKPWKAGSCKDLFGFLEGKRATFTRKVESPPVLCVCDDASDTFTQEQLKHFFQFDKGTNFLITTYNSKLKDTVATLPYKSRQKVEFFEFDKKVDNN